MIAIKPLVDERNRDFTFLILAGEIPKLWNCETLSGETYVLNMKIGKDYTPFAREGEPIRLSMDAKAPTYAFSAKSLSYENDFFLNPMVIELLEERPHVAPRYDDGQGSKIYLANCGFKGVPSRREAERLYGTRIANMMECFHLLR